MLEHAQRLDGVLSDAEFGDYQLHLEFQLPLANGPGEGGGSVEGGVFVSDRWEVQIADSAGRDLGVTSSGALFGVHAPLADAARPAGEWQEMDIRYEHWAGEPPHISVWLNGTLVQDDVSMTAATTGGVTTTLPGMMEGDAGARFQAAHGSSPQRIPWDESAWAVAAAFRSDANGTLVSRCPPLGDWAPDAKALFLRGGRLVYDIGWVGAMTSRGRFDDGQWHRVVLGSAAGRARMWVDGVLEAEREDFTAADHGEFTFKVGAANHNFGGPFDGEVEEVLFWAGGLDAAAAQAWSNSGANPDLEARASFHWVAPVDAAATKRFRRGDALSGPIRFQGGERGPLYRKVWLRPLEEVDPARQIQNLGESALNTGRKIYHGVCSACHGFDGLTATNPQARPFASGVLENGSDPYRLYQTIRHGFREMPASTWLSATETYAVVHYLREEFLRERNPSQYFHVDEAYLASLPKGRLHAMATEAGNQPRDFGPALASQLGDEVGSALSVHLGSETTIAYDLQQMVSAGVWQGGFLNLDATQHYQQRGEGKAQPRGKEWSMLSSYGWGHDGTLDWDRDLRPERGPLPKAWLDYHGHYVHGDKLILSYALDQREVLEHPFTIRTGRETWIAHSLRIGPGTSELVLQLAELPRKPGNGAALRSDHDLEEAWAECRFKGGDNSDSVMVNTAWQWQAASFFGRPDFTPYSPSLETDSSGRLLVRIPPAPYGLVLHLTRLQTGSDLGGLARLDIAADSKSFADPGKWTQGGGGPNWPQELITSGVLGEQGPYALDTLVLPAANPWNAWLRTSALDFFADGRAAVSTYGGDVWIVSGIDEGLRELRWKRFAAGMFEPMGVKVIDGLVYVTCRDRIVRLHDVDDDGEADFYQSFFADPDVSPNFHAFNFDLQVDGEGSLYYAKSGQYTDFDFPGAVLKIAADGSSHQVYATGLRTPNGMGMSRDGAPLVSDNQGNWIPASKINLVREGGFYGVFQAINTNTPGIQTRPDFDPPLIWMPQDFDSSSGGQLWVDDARFGPLSGLYLHTSFGKGWMYPFEVDEAVEPPQAGIWRLPFQFSSGIQRLRLNPADGQVYTVGLSGWQGPEGGGDGGLQRVRFVGGGTVIVSGARVLSDGVEVDFSAPVALELAGAGGPASAHGSLSAPDDFHVRRWNYLWSRNYGSAHYSVARPGSEGEDPVRVQSVTWSSDRTRLRLRFQDMVVCDQLSVEFDLGPTGSGAQRLLFTVNQVPPR